VSLRRVRPGRRASAAAACAGALWAAIASIGAAPAPHRHSVAEAERLAARSLELLGSRPDEALATAHEALALSAEFEPLAFVKSGRKGEVVEDEFVAARNEYRRHRARLYAAVGQALLRANRPLEASRYLRKAIELDGEPGRAADLARALSSLARSHEALDIILKNAAGTLGPAAQAAAAEAADAAGLPSLQAELDRVRLLALDVRPRIEVRDGPFRLPTRQRLSTGALVAFDSDDALTAVYVADPVCNTCSADLELLKRTVPASVRLWLAPAGPDRDEVLRRAMRLYRYDWPLLVGPALGATLDMPAPSMFLVARRGFIGAIVRPPFSRTLAPALEVFARSDVREQVPRASWNRRGVERRSAQSGPPLLPEGLAPGEDDPAPQEFTNAVAAYRAARFKEALALFEALAAKQDGFLLPPEARLNRALCLAGLGQREPARLMLLKIGDSRFQEAVDRTLEKVGSSRRP
jgi:tetratricopeptide (TPR) repeat protein